MGTDFTGIWAVIYNEGKAYLGKVIGTRSSFDGSLHVNGDKSADKITPSDILDSDWVTLNPAYDFFAPLRPVQQQGAVGYTRDPIVTPFDFAVDDTPVHVRVGAVAFFEDMTDNDRKTYESFITSADKMKQAARAQRSGIALVGADGKNIQDLNPRR